MEDVPRGIKSSRILESLAILNSRVDLERLLPTLLDVSLRLTGGERAFLLLYKEKDLSVRIARDRDGYDIPEEDFVGSMTVVERVLEQKEPLYVPRLDEVNEFAEAESVRAMKLKSAICLPLFHSPRDKEDGHPLGVLYIDSASGVHPLKESHMQLMEALANHVAISIENAKMFGELKVKNKEIASLNEQLKKHVELQAGTLSEMRVLLSERDRELGKLYGLGDIIGKSPPMLKVFKILEKVVPTDATVLILGESGTGKEMVAKHVHYNGARSEKPMISINCSAFSETLLESELFGHRKGAFTDAAENKIGLFQLADGGTMFLDEVAEMSAEMQKKLLRVLQDGEIRPVGSKEVQKVDVRIIAATNKDLKELIRQGKFRDDLYFRLNVISITLPPLRERREDIPLLIQFFTKRTAEQLKRELIPIPANILKQFSDHDWPGNVRELQNELSRYFILESEYQFSPESLQAEEATSMDALEKKAILKAMEITAGNKTKASELLGMSRRTFYDKLIKHNLF